MEIVPTLNFTGQCRDAILPRPAFGEAAQALR